MLHRPVNKPITNPTLGAFKMNHYIKIALVAVVAVAVAKKLPVINQWV